jgi:hypothetical protein
MLDAPRLTIFRFQRSGRGDGPSPSRYAVSTMRGSSVSGVTIAVPSLYPGAAELEIGHEPPNGRFCE